ncbi:uncharacterized [Tachysurus ichikawai]
MDTFLLEHARQHGATLVDRSVSNDKSQIRSTAQLGSLLSLAHLLFIAARVFTTLYDGLLVPEAVYFSLPLILQTGRRQARWNVALLGAEMYVIRNKNNANACLM